MEKYEGALDALFKQDQFSALLGKLSYSKEDQRQNCPPRHAVPIDGDIYNGTATLRSAIRLYQEFLATGSLQRSQRLAFQGNRDNALKLLEIGLNGSFPRLTQF